MASNSTGEPEDCSYTYAATRCQSASADGRVLAVQTGDLICACNPPLFDSPTIHGRNLSTGQTGIFPSDCLMRCIRANLRSNFDQLQAAAEVLITEIRMQQPGCPFYCGDSCYTRPIDWFYFDCSEDLAVVVRAYSAREEDEHSLAVSQVLWILHRRTSDLGWWLGEYNGRAAYVHCSCVMPLDEIQTLLAQWAMKGDFEAIRAIVTPELMRFYGKNGQTVLMLAATVDALQSKASAAKCVRYLIHSGCDPRASDTSGNTAAHMAAALDNIQLLALLPFEAKWLLNSMGFTPLMVAVQAGSWKCAKHLLHLLRQSRYRQQRDSCIHIRAGDGRTALDIAKDGGKNDIAQMIENEIGFNHAGPRSIFLEHTLEDTRKRLVRFAEKSQNSELRELLTLSNSDLPDRTGRTALCIFSDGKENNKHIARSLLSNCDPTCADVGGGTCLHAAMLSGNLVALQILLGAGVDVNACTEDGTTPLMQAARQTGCDDAVAVKMSRLLLQSGADWTARNSAGNTALSMARESRKTSLSTLLQQ
uniref:SH3 domain-containing protein n=1 Tax=Macrostomum lignano TaxID=282301 RepID=A0A1I8J1X7_9PLAT